MRASEQMASVVYLHMESSFNLATNYNIFRSRSSSSSCCHLLSDNFQLVSECEWQTKRPQDGTCIVVVFGLVIVGLREDPALEERRRRWQESKKQEGRTGGTVDLQDPVEEGGAGQPDKSHYVVCPDTTF